jgi:hypothetical protein
MNLSFRFLSLLLLISLHSPVFSAQQAVAKEKQAQEKEQKEHYAVTAPITATTMHMHATGNNQLRQFIRSTPMLNNPDLCAIMLAYVGPQWRPYKTLSTIRSDRWTDDGSVRYGFWRGGQLRFEDNGKSVVLPLAGWGRDEQGRAITWNVSTGECLGNNQPDVWNKGGEDSDEIEQRPAAYIETEDGIIRGQHLTRYYDRVVVPPQETVGVVRQHQVQLDIDQTALLKKIVAASEQPTAPASAAAANAPTTTTASTLNTIGVAGVWQHLVTFAWLRHRGNQGAKK